MAALRLALCLGVIGVIVVAGAGRGWSQYVPHVTTTVPRMPIPTPMPTPMPQIQMPTPMPRIEAPSMGQRALPQAAPNVAAPSAVLRAQPIMRATLARALSVAGNSRCDITASLQERCRRGQSCKLSCQPSLCPQLGGQQFCEFLLNCAVEFVARVVMDDPVCKARSEVRMVTAPGGGRSYLVTVPVGYDCDPPQCAQ